MSGNDASNQNQESTDPSRSPVPPQPSSSFGMQAPNIVCAICHTVVPIGTAYCPQCGSPLPNSVPPSWAGAPAPAPGKRNAALIFGIVLIVIIVVGIGGFAFYQSEQQAVLQAAKNSERDAANQSVNQLQATCFSNRTDISGLSYYNGVFYGSMIIYETFGISNPTRFPIHATWTVIVDLPGPSWVLTDTKSFDLLSNGIGYPTFGFSLSGNQLNQLTNSTDLRTFTVTVDSTYLVTGSYALYTVTQHSTYDSSSNTGTGTIGSSGSLPKC